MEDSTNMSEAFPLVLPLVSVVVPTMNRREMVLACLQSILGNQYSNMEVIVVDNGSSDGTSACVASQFSQVKLITLPNNIFLAGARNVGASHASGKYLLFVDDDNDVDVHMIDAMVDLFEKDESIGAAGPKNYYYGKDKLLLWTGQTIGRWSSWTRFNGVRQRDEGQFDEVVETDGIPNVMMMRSDIFRELGGFDEVYRMSYADADLPMKFRRAGYRAVYNPRAIVYHKVEPDSVSNRMPMRAYYYARNRVIFMKRFSTPLQFLVFFLCFFPAFTLFYIFRQLRLRDFSDIPMHIRGSWDGFLFGLHGRERDYFSRQNMGLEHSDLVVEKK